MQLLSMSLLVSSSEWHLSLADAKGPSAAHVSDIVLQLQRIVSLAREVLQANECSLSKIEFMDWEPLYTLEPSKDTGKNEGERNDGDDDFGGGGDGGGGGEEEGERGGGTSGSAAVRRGTSPGGKEASLKKLFEEKHILAKCLTELGNDVGFFQDTANGRKMQVEQESISLEAVHSKDGASRCEADPKAFEQDMLCPINLTIMEHPVKYFRNYASQL